MDQLVRWREFYVLIGSSCAALIGLLFVVLALIGDLHLRITTQPIRAFGTPTVLHLTAGLLISAVLIAPWPSLLPITIALGGYGLLGMAYCPIVIHRARRQTFHKPLFADWIWYVFLPLIIHAALFLAALVLGSYTEVALFIIGGVSLGLMLLGLRNAWDSLTGIVTSGEVDIRSPK